MFAAVCCLMASNTSCRPDCFAASAEHLRERGLYTFKMQTEKCAVLIRYLILKFFVSTCFFSDALVGMRDDILHGHSLPVKGCKLHT